MGGRNEFQKCMKLDIEMTMIPFDLYRTRQIHTPSAPKEGEFDVLHLPIQKLIPVRVHVEVLDCEREFGRDLRDVQAQEAGVDPVPDCRRSPDE